MHLDGELLQRLVHGEVDAPTQQSARAHIAACQACQAAMHDAQQEERWIERLLHRLDHDSPPVTAGIIMARGRAARRFRVRVAAGILLGILASGAAYAAPGSPLPGLLRRLVDQVQWSPGKEQPLPTPGTAGIAVAPGHRFTVVFEPSDFEGIADVWLSDVEMLTVRERRASAAFATASDRLTIRSTGGPSSYEIELPRRAPWVEIRVGPHRVFLKDGDRVITAADATQDGHYRLTLGSH